MIKPNPHFKITYHTFEQKESIEDLLEMLQDDSNFISCRTSGSTGIPKLIQFSKKSLRTSAQNSIDYFKLQEKQSATLCISVDFVAGLMMLVRAIISGMHLHVTPVSSFTYNYINFNVDFIALFPKQLDGFINHPKGIQILKKIRNILVGGAPINLNTEKQLISEEITIHHSYGMTETLTHVAIKKTGFKGEDTYHALPGISFDIKNDCLAIHYPEIRDQKLTTNDIVELIDDSSFKWLGRSDFVINTGGYKISPEELEQKIAGLFNLDYMIMGIVDNEFGQKIAIVFKGQAPQVMSKKLFPKNIHPYEIPKLYTVLNEFHSTQNGKLDRRMTALKTKESVWKKIL